MLTDALLLFRGLVPEPITTVNCSEYVIVEVSSK
jgi:hypothetical protein